MPALVMFQGLPGSGKTTAALAELRNGLNAGKVVVRTNKDDIRRQLEETGWVWSPENEKRVVEIQNDAIRKAFENGADVVIVDDTNFGKHRARLAAIAAEYNATFEVRKFDLPVGECVKRDSLREGKARVGESVILDMARRYHIRIDPYYERFAKYTPNRDKPWALICDLDGTLALHHGRSPYDTAQCEQDIVNTPVLHAIRGLECYLGALTIFVSGRSATFRPQTEAWLKANGIDGYLLFMRPAGDCRPDWLVKGELFDNHIRNHFNVQWVFDDRNQVVNMWRHLGLTVFQVADGDF